ncbi:hypothetical protein Zmor_020500 [Zophobas morio]|uniref:Uncharacterized protein n=1 Tax=Zophobas morio TaxID=2755281 RepID=A0AA38I3K6_9CUCU|nr:hypothetical protein Zmor_020500 [Zophobas morio]
MGCSPSVLLEHIHRDSTANHEKNIKRTTTQSKKKDTSRTVIHRKSSLALTPEDEPLEYNVSQIKSTDLEQQ